MKLLITGAWNATEKELDIIKNMGFTVCFMQTEKDPLPCSYEDVDGVICNGLFLYHDIEKFSNLKFIQLTSAGFDRVPMDYIKAHDIKIYNARGVYSIPMAEFVIMGVLSLYKNSKFFFENQKNTLWEKDRNLIELYGKTVSIVGAGSVGTECAKRFKAFGCTIYGVDLFEINNSVYDKSFLIDDIDCALKTSDVVVLTLPLTKETENLFDENRLHKMKNGAILVNIARGKIVDEGALINALNSNLGGAVLDVFENEPLSNDSPLWELKNVILTPHNSFIGDGNYERLSKVIIENLKKIND